MSNAKTFQTGRSRSYLTLLNVADERVLRCRRRRSRSNWRSRSAPVSYDQIAAVPYGVVHSANAYYNTWAWPGADPSAHPLHAILLTLAIIGLIFGASPSEDHTACHAQDAAGHPCFMPLRSPRGILASLLAMAGSLLFLRPSCDCGVPLSASCRQAIQVYHTRNNDPDACFDFFCAPCLDCGRCIDHLLWSFCISVAACGHLWCNWTRSPGTATVVCWLDCAAVGLSLLVIITLKEEINWLGIGLYSLLGLFAGLGFWKTIPDRDSRWLLVVVCRM